VIALVIKSKFPIIDRTLDIECLKGLFLGSVLHWVNANERGSEDPPEDDDDV